MWRWWAEYLMKLKPPKVEEGVLDAYAFSSFVVTCTRVHTCTLSWMSPHCVLLCLFSFLAVEPFNTQPQLYYIALSRSYKGSFSAWCPVRADKFLFKWSWQHALIPLHFLLPTWKHASVALRWLEVHSSLLSVETFPITLPSLGRKLLGGLVAKNGSLPRHKVRSIRRAWHCVDMLWAAVFLVWIYFDGCAMLLCVHFSWSCHLEGKLLTQWDLLNPCVLLLCLQNRQLQGLKGLFNKNPRHGSSENNSHYVRKRSIGDRILRRTASAPAKGRKKSKMGFQEMVEIKDSVSEASRDQDGVLRRTTRSLQERPVSLPVDKSLLGALSLPISATAKDTEGKEHSLGKMLYVSLRTTLLKPYFGPWLPLWPGWHFIVKVKLY